MDLTVYGSEYQSFLGEIKEEIQKTQYRAMVKVNQEMIFLYWTLGKRILELQEQTSWGEKLIEKLAADLKSEFPNTKGYTKRNLFYMKKFALENPDFTIVQTPSAQISWSHNILLLDRFKDKVEREWYVKKSIENGWSVRVLNHQIDSQLYNRIGKAVNNFQNTLPEIRSDMAKDLLKDPYNFDFLELTQEAHEKDLEEALIKHITHFLLELGVGFAFVGRQYLFTVENKDYRIDLLFYHLKLRCYIVIELKIGDFVPEYVGKLNFYINAVNGEIKGQHDQPTIGILLCKNKGGVVTAEYALSNVGNPIGISSYTVKGEDMTVLPTVEMLEDELKNVQ